MSVNWNDLSETNPKAVDWNSLSDTPPKPAGTLGAYGQTIKQAVKGIPAYVNAAIEGDQPYSQNDTSDRVIAENEANQQAFINGPNADAPVLGGLAKERDIRQGADSMSGTIATMAPALAGFAVGGPLGAIAGAGVGLYGMKRYDENQFIRQNIDNANAERVAQRQPELGQPEAVALQDKLVATGDPQTHGLWEAGSELLGTAGELGIALSPLKGAAGLLKPFAPLARAALVGLGKATGMLGTEIGEELVTNVGQNPIQKKYGFPEQTAGETAKQTAIQMLPLAGLGGAGGAYQGYTYKPGPLENAARSTPVPLSGADGLTAGNTIPPTLNTQTGDPNVHPFDAAQGESNPSPDTGNLSAPASIPAQPTPRQAGKAANTAFLQPGELRRQELTARATAAGITDPKTLDAILPKETLDAVTGYYPASDKVPTVKRALEHVNKTGESAYYVEADIANLGGLNSHFKNNSEQANPVYRAISDIFAEEMAKAGHTAVNIRHGGDEFGSVVIGGTKESIAQAKHNTYARIEALMEAQGLHTLPHAKSRPDAPKPNGVHLYMGHSEILPGKTLADIFKQSSSELDSGKIGALNVGRKETGTTGNEALDRQPGGAPTLASANLGASGTGGREVAPGITTTLSKQTGGLNATQNLNSTGTTGLGANGSLVPYGQALDGAGTQTTAGELPTLAEGDAVGAAQGDFGSASEGSEAGRRGQIPGIDAEPFTPTHELSDGTPVMQSGDNTFQDAQGDEYIGDAYTRPIEHEKTQQQAKNDLTQPPIEPAQDAPSDEWAKYERDYKDFYGKEPPLYDDSGKTYPAFTPSRDELNDAPKKTIAADSNAQPKTPGDLHPSAPGTVEDVAQAEEKALVGETDTAAGLTHAPTQTPTESATPPVEPQAKSRQTATAPGTPVPDKNVQTPVPAAVPAAATGPEISAEPGVSGIVNKRTGLPFTTASQAQSALASTTAYTEATPQTHTVQPAPEGQKGFVLTPKETVLSKAKTYFAKMVANTSEEDMQKAKTGFGISAAMFAKRYANPITEPELHKQIYNIYYDHFNNLKQEQPLEQSSQATPANEKEATGKKAGDLTPVARSEGTYTEYPAKQAYGGNDWSSYDGKQRMSSEHPDFQPNDRQQTIIAATQQAQEEFARDGKYPYNTDITDRVGEIMGVAKDSPLRKSDKINRSASGAFGYDVYLAGQYLDKQKALAVNIKAISELNLSKGMKIGSLKANGKLIKNVVIADVDRSGATITYTAGNKPMQAHVDNIAHLKTMAQEAGNKLFDKPATTQTDTATDKENLTVGSTWNGKHGPRRIEKIVGDRAFISTNGNTKTLDVTLVSELSQLKLEDEAWYRTAQKKVDREEKAQETVTPEFKALPEKSQNLFNGALERKEANELKQIVHPDNKAWRGEFKSRTGLKLPKTVKATNAAVDDWLKANTQATETKAEAAKSELELNKAPETKGKVIAKEGDSFVDAHGENQWHVREDVTDGSDNIGLHVTIGKDTLGQKRKSITLGELKARIAEDKDFHERMTKIRTDKETKAPVSKPQAQPKAPTNAELLKAAQDSGKLEIIHVTNTPKAEAQEQPVYGANNKIFTKDAADAARERLKAKLGRLNAGFDPEMMLDGLTLGGYHVEAGARTFAAYSRSMINDLGNGIIPYLQHFYNSVRDYPGFDNKGMASYESLAVSKKYGIYQGELWAFREEEAREVSDINANYITFKTKSKNGSWQVPTNNYLQQKAEWKLVGPETVDSVKIKLTEDPIKQEKKDEHKGNGGTGQGTLESELPGTLPKDEQGGTTGRGSRGGSGTDKSGNGRTENGGDKRTSGLGSGEGTVPTDETGAKLDEGLERELADEDYAIDDAELGHGTYGEKLAANMAAIRLVKQLEAEKRLPTQEEKAVLSNFIGWGALKNVFDTHSKVKQDRVALAELKTLLNENELFWAGQGVLAQHFTSPEVISGIYDMLAHLGFKGGNVLEPTVGTGNFIGLMPVGMKNSSKWYASEIDPIAGNIAKYLYPESTILAGEGFQNAEYPYEKFDLAIGNPPFGDERITDKAINRKAINGFKIHNYMLAKSAMHLKPGGVMAFVVTNRFLDTKDAEARTFLAANFNMLAALRLPNTAFKKNAGTEVTTDIIFLQKRIPGQPESNSNWLNTNGTLVNEDGESIRLNQYFADNPNSMLGKPTMKGTMYGNGEQFALLPNEHAGQSLGGQIFSTIKSRFGDLKDLLKTQHNAVMDAQSDKIELNRADVAIGGYILEGDRIFMRQDDDALGNSVFKILTPATPWTEKTVLGGKRYQRIKSMLSLRAKAYALIEAERSDRSTIEILRKSLNKAYDAFVTEHGYLNSRENFRLMAGDVKIEYGLEVNFKAAISAQVSRKTGFSESAETADKADILKKRLFYPYQEVLAAANATDGYSISMSEKGKLDLDYIAGLTGLSKADVIEELSSGDNPLIFKDPKTGEYVQEDEYLSGNVKRKLEQAIDARGFDKNVAALTAVQPKDIKQDEIFKDLGQTWIPKQVYEQFLSMLGITNANVSMDTTTGSVGVNGDYNAIASAIGKVFDNPDYSIGELFNLIANKKAIVAYDTTRDSRVKNPERTKELQGLAKRMTTLFRDWIFADTLRADDLTKLYNKTQNTTVPRKLDGKHLRTVGANTAITLRDTQRSAAWRMIQQSTVLLDHVVGAGKTMTIIAGIMERRRLGLSKKPMVVVPNHLVSQWSKEFFELYPGAKILAASEKDFSKPNRRRLFARIATGDYDAIIVGHSSFKFIPVDREIENQFVQGEVKHLNDALEAAIDNNDRRSVRTIKNRIAKRLQRLAKLNAAPSDDVASFQQMGIDYLTVDESHAYKNLEYATGMNTLPGMGSPEGSQQAFDMYMKLRILLDQDKGGVTFATGTPISNSLVEMYSIMRYLNKQGLQERGIESFDAWARNYASVDSVIEYMSTGKLKERTILGSFNNVPEMMQLYNEFADTVTMDDLKRIYSEQIKRENAEKGTNKRTDFPVPKVKGGDRQLIKADPSTQQLEYIDYLIERSLNVEEDMKSKDFDAQIDNTLWVYGDAKKAALDLRILDPSASDNPTSKVNKAIVEIKKLYQQWHKDSGTQLVFIDLSTPSKTATKDAVRMLNDIKKKLKIAAKSNAERTLDSIDGYDQKWRYLKAKLDTALSAEDITGEDYEALQTYIANMEADSAVFATANSGFSVYDDMKAKLVAGGIPEYEVQFIHSFDTAVKKKELFALVNSGKVRILLGSTAKMGAGTNVQERLVGLHHIDASQHNRPSDIEQREGRIIRQGNKLYERDPDGFEIVINAYSTERTFDAVSWQTLAKKARMLESFRTGARSVEEDQGDSKGYMEFMAETTGNPIFREKIKLESEIAELEATERRLTAQLSAANNTLDNAESDRRILQKRIDKAQTVVDALGDASVLELDGKNYANDYEQVLAKETAAYHQEYRAYADKLEAYNLVRDEYDKKEKGKRGKAPSKPLPPLSPTVMSERMDKSSGAQFLRKLLTQIDGLKNPGDNLVFKIGDQSFYARLFKGRGKDAKPGLTIADSSNLKSLDFPDNSITYSDVIRVVDKFTRKNYLGEVHYQKDRQKRHEEQVKAAEGFVKSNKLEQSDELKAKQRRFKQVKAIVDSFEENEAKRREQLDNKYIREDVRRFPNGKPRPKTRAAAQPDSEEEQQAYDNIPGYGHMRPFTQGDNKDDAELVKGYGWMMPAKGEAQFSQRPATPGIVVNRTAINTVINRVIAAAPSHISRKTVIVADGFASLPEAVRKVATQQGYDPNNPKQRINGVTYQGKIYIVHGNVQSESEVEEVLLHERIHQILHGDKTDPQGQKLSAALNDLYLKLGGMGGINTLAESLGINFKDARQQALQMKPGAARNAFLVDEFLAEAEGRRAYEHWPEKVVRALREFYGKLRTWLRANGFTALANSLGMKLNEFTPADLARLLRRIRSKDSGSGSESVRFSFAGKNAQTADLHQLNTAIPDTLTIDGKSRPTRNSDGKLIHPTEAGIRNFYAWFQNSVVVDDQGRPLVVYHGGKGGINIFDPNLAGTINTSDWGKGVYFTPSKYQAEGYMEDSNKTNDKLSNDLWDKMEAKAKEFGTDIMNASIDLRSKKITQEQYDELKLIDQEWRNARTEASKNGNGEVYSAYLNISNPEFDSYQGITDPFMSERVKSKGKDGIIIQYENGGFDELVAFNANQVKSAIGNNGDFSPENNNVLFSMRADEEQAADSLPAVNTWLSKWLNQKTKDTAIYNLQDRYIDLYRQMQKITKAGGVITESEDARVGEEVSHQRIESRIKEFYATKFNPILKTLHDSKMDMDTFQGVLHARHAPSRNKVMAERNPNQDIIDTKLAEAEQALADAVTNKDKQTAATEVAKWQRAKPFNGTEEERLSLSGMTDEQAQDTLDNLTSEQSRVLLPLADKIDAINNETLDLMVDYGMETEDSIQALKDQWQHYVPLHRDEAHPDDANFGHPIGRGYSIRGSGIKTATGSNAEVTNIMAHIAAAREQMLRRGEKNQVTMQLAEFITNHPDPEFAKTQPLPTKDYLVNGLVETLPDPTYKDKNNVVIYRDQGKDKALLFNEYVPENVRLAMALKNLNGIELDKVESLIAKGTRWLASVNTQYNVIFGITNVTRDVQTAMLNLSSTPLQGKQRAVLAKMADSVKIISGVERGWAHTDPALKALYERFNKAGGTTAYSQMFAGIKDRDHAIRNELKRLDEGKAMHIGRSVVKALSDFNTVMENSTRLAVFMTAVESGMSDTKAASLAKNITVNFNRKGAYTTKVGAMYAFFNASVQGSFRMAETLKGPAGKQILMGGVGLGAALTVLGIAAMGADDWDKIPEFIKERSLIIPAPWNSAGYIAIPMPLGFHILPNIGRKFVESMLGSNRITPTKRFAQLLSSTTSAFNPLGGSDISGLVMPTVLDPALALWRNQDWTGKTVYQQDFNSLDPTPGYLRAKDTASTPSRIAAEAVNALTGGTAYKPGLWSPTPDQLDYVISQLTGGTGREILKAQQALASIGSDEELPTYKVPLLGRFYGTVTGDAAERSTYYENLRLLNEEHNEVEGLRKEENGHAKAAQYLRDNPLARVYNRAHIIQKSIDRLKKHPGSEKRIAALMAKQNEIVDQAYN